MKKTVWTFGLISGGIVSGLMLALLPFHDAIGFDRGLVVGYTTMVAAFLLIYFGIRSYRDNVGNGSISFGRAFALGTLIAVISSACYTATWEVIYYTIKPDFIAKYQDYEIGKLKASGASQAELTQHTADLQRFAEAYKNPVVNSAMTFIEPFPVGLAIALLSAAVLRRRSSQRTRPETSTPDSAALSARDFLRPPT